MDSASFTAEGRGRAPTTNAMADRMRFGYLPWWGGAVGEDALGRPSASAWNTGLTVRPAKSPRRAKSPFRRSNGRGPFTDKRRFDAGPPASANFPRESVSDPALAGCVRCSQGLCGWALVLHDRTFSGSIQSPVTDETVVEILALQFAEHSAQRQNAALRL